MRLRAIVLLMSVIVMVESSLSELIGRDKRMAVDGYILFNINVRVAIKPLGRVLRY